MIAWNGLRNRRRTQAVASEDLGAGAGSQDCLAATEGATNAGAVTFEDVGGGQTRVNLILEYEPEGLIEKVGDKAQHR